MADGERSSQQPAPVVGRVLVVRRKESESTPEAVRFRLAKTVAAPREVRRQRLPDPVMQEEHAGGVQYAAYLGEGGQRLVEDVQHG